MNTPPSAAFLSTVVVASIAMAVRDYFITFIMVFQTMAHFVCYMLFIAVSYILHIVELMCWTIDMHIEDILASQAGQTCTSIPGYINITKRLVRGVWRALMRAIVYIHVSHSFLCNSTYHALPCQVDSLAAYFKDHPTGPCADYNLN